MVIYVYYIWRHAFHVFTIQMVFLVLFTYTMYKGEVQVLISGKFFVSRFLPKFGESWSHISHLTIITKKELFSSRRTYVSSGTSTCTTVESWNSSNLQHYLSLLNVTNIIFSCFTKVQQQCVIFIVCVPVFARLINSLPRDSLRTSKNIPRVLNFWRQVHCTSSSYATNEHILSKIYNIIEQKREVTWSYVFFPFCIFMNTYEILLPALEVFSCCRQR